MKGKTYFLRKPEKGKKIYFIMNFTINFLLRKFLTQPKQGKESM